MVNIALIPLVIPRSKKGEMKPPYVCPRCSNHTYNNNMINRCHVQQYRVIISYIMTHGSEENYINAVEKIRVGWAFTGVDQ
jgi:hypothetical protein